MPFKFNPLSGRFDLVESSSGLPLPVSDGGTGRSTLTDGAVLVGNGTSPITMIGPLTDGQLLIGSTLGIDPVPGTITSLDGTVTITNGSGTIDLSVGQQITGTGQTIGAVTANVITFSLGSTPGTYALEARVSAFNSSTPAGAGFQIFGTVRTTGAAAVLVGIPDIVNNAEAALLGSLADIVVSANTAIIQVTGLALLTIDWGASLSYTFRG